VQLWGWWIQDEWGKRREKEVVVEVIIIKTQNEFDKEIRKSMKE
jgi:hypothetical protein